MLDVPLKVFTAVKKARNEAKAAGTASFSMPFVTYDADKPANKITIVGNPTLGEVKTMIIGVRNLSGEEKSGEVWVNELRLLEYNNEGGWAARGKLNIQLSDFGTIDLNGSYITDGFGGIEQGVNERQQETTSDYTLTTNFDLGKFFPDKARVSAPIYYSVQRTQSRPKYNPLDTDMELQDALDAAGSRSERDSIESIAVTKQTTTNFSLSNVRVGIQNKRHPMPYDPANFSFSYSHSHTHTSGETTVYENEDNWRGALSYSWTPVYKSWEPFKKIKNRSKWLEIFKRFGLNWLPQNIGFNTEMTRSYYELQERDMESTENAMLPLTFSQQFLWNRDFTIRWDLTKNLHMNFQSATHAEIEEPYTPVNKDLYPDQYQAWKDSVKQSIRHWGRPLDFNQSFNASYQLPLNLIPIFDWVNADASYASTYSWVRGSDLEDGTSLGNTISMSRTINLNGTFNLEKLYNQFPFLKKTNERFKQSKRNNRRRPNASGRDQRTPNPPQKPKNDKDKDKADDKDDKAGNKKKELPKNRRSFEREVTIKADTTMVINHGKKTRRLVVTAKDADGKTIDVRWKKVDDNKIKIFNKTDSTIRMKLTVTPKEPLDDKRWYKTAQCVARVLMTARSFSISYRDQYAMMLPGFMPVIGKAFGQRSGDALAPGLDFAFGMTGDSYIDRARERGWLLSNDSVATPATTNHTQDLQLRMTLEPVNNLKIDLNASRTQTTAKSIQYMYQGNPTTQSGSFTMTTLSLGSAFEGMGDAANGYHSATFEKFVRSLDGYRDRVEAQYVGQQYPAALGGGKFDPAKGAVDKYSGDVMIPAFLNAYTGMGSVGLNIFPTLASLLPNWTVRYSGLSQLPWFRDLFKSVNINHSYKSIYSVGAYQSYSTWLALNGDLGFVQDAATGSPIPSSMFNVSMVSINESFSPLLGLSVTTLNNLTAEIKYNQTRQLSLSMTSVQVNEAISKDWVLGFGYKINNFDLFGPRGRKKLKTKKQGDGQQQGSQNSQNNRGQAARGGVNRDLNLRLDLSFRKQAAITRDIATMTSSASSGNSAFKLSFSADYTLSRLVTMSFYYDMQTNTPLLSSSSYPTTTHDFGFNVKLSLTR